MAIRERISTLIPKNIFARQVSILTGGTVFAQGLAVISLPILTRIYSPSDFSMLAVYASLIGFVSVFSCLRYNIAIPLPKEDEDAINLLAISAIAALIISLFIALPIIAAPTYIALLLKQPDIEAYLWMIPVGVLLASLYNAVQYWTTRRKQFGLITRTRITRAVGGSGTQITIGAVFAGPFGLLFGHMIYGGLGLIGLLLALWRNDRAILAKITMQNLRNNFYKYRSFPINSTPAAILNAGYQHIPILMLAGVISGAKMGLVFLAIKVMAIPVSLVGAAISQVYLGSAREYIDNGTLGHFTQRTMRILLFVGTPILILLAIMSYYLFGFVFGEEYSEAGGIILWMLPWFITQLIASPVSGFYTVIDKLGIWLILQGIGFFMIVGAVALSSFIYPQYMVEIFAMICALFYTIVAIAIWISSKKYEYHSDLI